MVSGPKLALILSAFPGSVLVPVDEIEKPSAVRVPPTSSPRRPTMTTNDPTRESPRGAPAAAGAASARSGGSRPPKAIPRGGEGAVVALMELVGDLAELHEAVDAMYEYMVKDDPERGGRKGWVRIREALDKAGPWAEAYRLDVLSNPGEDRVRNPGSPTDTQAAALTAMPISGTARLATLDVLVHAMPEGATDEEIAEITCLAMNTVRPRRGELVTGGWVEDSGVHRPTESGNEAIVWRVTIPGRERLGMPPRV